MKMKIEENINTTNNIVDEDDEVENGETLEVKLEDNENMKQALEDLGPLLSDEDFDPGNFCTIFFVYFCLFIYLFTFFFQMQVVIPMILILKWKTPPMISEKNLNQRQNLNQRLILKLNVITVAKCF